MVREDEEAKIVLRRLMENLGEASEVLIDLGEYLELIERRGRRVVRRMIRAGAIMATGFVIAILITGIAIDRADKEADAAHEATQQLQKIAKRNSRAIEVGCTLLVNAIIEAEAKKISIPNCREIAKHPERVVALPQSP